MSRLVIVGANSNIGKHIVSDFETFPSLKYSHLKMYGKSFPLPYRFDMTIDIPETVFADASQDDRFILLSAISDPNKVYANQEIAWDINVNKTIRLIDYLISRNSPFIFISSVEVFDGEGAPYTERAKTKPLNLYGKTKEAIEKYLASKVDFTNYVILRIPWNISLDLSSRCLISDTYKNLLTPNYQVAVDYFSSAIATIDTARFINKLSEFNLKEMPRILHLSSPEYFNRKMLADFIICESGFGMKMKLRETYFENLKLSEPRASDTRLDSTYSRSLLNFQCLNIWDVIREKVQMLDGIYV